jgi:HK97 family phage major capsid protein
MATLKELLEKRGKAAHRIGEMRDVVSKGNRDFTAEERAEWEKVNAEYDSLRAQADVMERADTVAGAAVQRETQTGAINASEAFAAWGRSANRDSSEADRQLARAAGFDPAQNELGFRFTTNRQTRAMSAITGAAGGFTVPEGFVNNLSEALLAWGGVRNRATILTTSTGNDLPWPTVNDTGNSGEIIGENVAQAEATVPTFGRRVFRAYEFSSKPMLVPNALLQDSAFDLGAYIGEAAGVRIGRRQNLAFTTGNDVSQPQGIVTGATLGVTTDAPTAITSDKVIELQHSVGRAYRGLGTFMMNDAILLYIRKLKETVTGNYLWQPGLQLNAPDMLLGRPIEINDDMCATITAGDKTMLFGYLGAYVIRDVTQIIVKRLVERYAEYNQTGFLTIVRSDGAMLDAGTHPVRYMLQHA